MRAAADRRLAEWRAQAARRAAKAGGAESTEDAIVRALLDADAAALAEAARLRATADLLDHDYLAYWIDALDLQERWRALA